MLKAAKGGQVSRVNGEIVTDYLEHKRQRSQKDVDDFAALLAKNPAHAFEYADKAMEAAAELIVVGMVDAWIKRGLDVEQIRRELTNEIMRNAMWPSRSSSPTFNLIHQQIMAATARTLDTLNNIGSDD